MAASARACSGVRAMPLAGCRRSSRRKQRGEFLAVLGVFDRVDAGADDRHAGGGQGPGQVQRRLAAELHDHAVGLHAVANIEHVFGRQGSKNKQVAGVVIGADRFGVRVDHDRLDPQLAQGEAAWQQQ